MAKPNYAFEKRQRELEKKRKKEDKAQRKASGLDTADDAAAPDEGDAAVAPATANPVPGTADGAA